MALKKKKNKQKRVPKRRIPLAPPSKRFKSLKDYDRSKNKKTIEENANE